VVRHHQALNRPLQPRCSICIANYNGEQLLVDCLDSVFGQQCDVNFEVIVHDDASTDGSVALLRDRYPQVELLASEENVGFCISNNRMVEHARGEFVLLLNNDAALFPDALATLLTAANAQTSHGILTLPQYDWTTEVLVDRGCLLDPFYNPVPNLDPARSDVAMTIGACVFLRRSLWHELGGFPEWMESIGEDIYLCCMARLRGIHVHALDTSGYRHRQGSSFGGNRVHAGRMNTTYRRRRLSERNRTFALVIFTPTPVAWLLLGIHLAVLALEGTAIGLLRWDRKLFSEVYLSAFTSLYREQARLRELRAGIQCSRIATVRNFLSCFTPVPRKIVMLLRHGLPDIR
jgi:GT2 family glycosyltransferase